MMRQQSLHTDGFEKYRKPTRKEIFLKDMSKGVSTLFELTE